MAVAGASIVQAQANPAVGGVTLNGNTAYRIQNGHLSALTNKLTLPFQVEVNTNGEFTVGKGGKRQLQPGQVIRNDGWLTSPNGSVQPVYDHIAVQEGKVIVVRDGQPKTLTEPMTCTNNLHLSPDGYAVYPDGLRKRLLDGQLFRLDGTPIQAEDAVTLANGQVVVQKSGTLVHLLPVQMMGMDDGTKIYGDGTVQRFNGPTFKLHEGQTVLIKGIVVGH